jgi:threonine dehydratase
MIDRRTQSLDIRQLVLDAEERCRPYLFETPLEYSHHLSELSGAKVWLKLDLVQKTTSFKLRGATNKVMALSEEEVERGVVTASTGNYAFAVAEAISHRGRTATTYVAEDITPSRLELMRSHGLDVVMHGAHAGESEAEARRVAEQEGKTYVSPYNDPLVVGGQGTCGLEISRQLPDLEVAVFAVGGGGLIGGSGGWLKTYNPDIEIYGVSPENSPVMYESLKADRIVDIETLPTLADTCAGGIDHDAITLELCQKYIDEMILLTEAEIEDAIRLLFEHHRLVAEGWAAMSIGAVLKHPDRFAGKKVVLEVCGRNIDLARFREIISD